MKTLKEIKEHFINAKEVKCLSDGMIYKLTNKLLNNIKFYENVIIASSKGIEIVLVEKYNFAEIISYKKPKFKYLEKVICSEQEDFSNSRICYYACKNTLKGYVVFSKYDAVLVFKYIKKIK